MKFGSLGSNKHQKKVAMSRERKLAAELGGKAQPNSGAMDGMKGDILTSKYLIDDKFTKSKGYSIKVLELNKITLEAYENNREPVLIVKFEKHVAKNTPSEWCLVPSDLLDIKIPEDQVILGKSLFLSVQIVNTLYSRCIKNEVETAKQLIFYKVALGVSNKWTLIPLDDLKERGFFNE